MGLHNAALAEGSMERCTCPSVMALMTRLGPAAHPQQICIRCELKRSSCWHGWVRKLTPRVWRSPSPPCCACCLVSERSCSIVGLKFLPPSALCRGGVGGWQRVGMSFWGQWELIQTSRAALACQITLFYSPTRKWSGNQTIPLLSPCRPQSWDSPGSALRIWALVSSRSNM